MTTRKFGGNGAGAPPDLRYEFVIASGAKQSSAQCKRPWIASSLRFSQ
jgi:hypothetical protein